MCAYDGKSSFLLDYNDGNSDMSLYRRVECLGKHLPLDRIYISNDRILYPPRSRRTFQKRHDEFPLFIMALAVLLFDTGVDGRRYHGYLLPGDPVDREYGNHDLRLDLNSMKVMDLFLIAPFENFRF